MTDTTPAGHDAAATPAVDENRLIHERRLKLAEWRAGGQAYPNDFRRNALAGDLQVAYAARDAAALVFFRRSPCPVSFSSAASRSA